MHPKKKKNIPDRRCNVGIPSHEFMFTSLTEVWGNKILSIPLWLIAVYTCAALVRKGTQQKHAGSSIMYFFLEREEREGPHQRGYCMRLLRGDNFISHYCPPTPHPIYQTCNLNINRWPPTREWIASAYILAWLLAACVFFFFSFNLFALAQQCAGP